LFFVVTREARLQGKSSASQSSLHEKAAFYTCFLTIFDLGKNNKIPIPAPVDKLLITGIVK
jgi:hypothetical protein